MPNQFNFLESNEDEQRPQSKKKLKATKGDKDETQRDSTIEDLQRDILVRDDTIKEQNMVIVELETKMKAAVDKADKSKRATNDYKLSHLENDLRHAKSELVLNSERIQKFMEEGSKTIDEYRENFAQSQQEVLDIKQEVSSKEALLKNKDDVYRRILDDLQEARRRIGILQMEKLQQDTRTNQLQADLDRTNDEKNDLEDRILNLESVHNKIDKQNELVKELNTQFYGLSIDELGQEINQSMFDMILDLKSNHLKHIIDGTLDLKYALKEDGKYDLAAQLEEIQNLKEESEYESEDEGEEGENDKTEEKKVENPHKSLPKPVKDQNKLKRVGGGFQLETDDKMQKEDRLKDQIKKKKEEEWKKYVENAKKNNEILKMLMNLSNEKVKDKDGKWITKPSFSLMKRNMK